MPRALGGLAGAAVLAANYERAARLFGAMAAMRDVSGTGEAARSFRVAYERDEAKARAILGEEAFAAAWAASRVMSLEQAVAFALGEPDARALNLQGALERHEVLRYPQGMQPLLHRSVSTNSVSSCAASVAMTT